MKKIIAIIALGLLTGCNTPAKPSPSSSGSPTATAPKRSTTDSKAIIAEAKEKGKAFMAESEDNGFLPLMTYLEKNEESLAIVEEATEAWDKDGLEGIKKFAKAHPDYADNLKPAQEQLKAALDKPKYYPILSFDMNEPLPNFILVRRLNQGLLHLSALQMENEPGEAVGTALIALRAGARLSGKGNLFTQAMSGILQKEALSSVAGFLKPESLSKEQAENILAALKSLPASPKDYSQARDFEFVPQYNNYDDLADGKLEGKDVSEELKGANFDLQEERKALDMLFLTNRDSIMMLKDTKAAEEELVKKIEANPKVILGKISAGSYQTMYDRARKANSLLEGTKILAAVRLYQLENGQPPEKLEDLSPKYLDSVPTNVLAEDGRYVYSVKDKTFTLSDGAAVEPVQFYP